MNILDVRDLHVEFSIHGHKLRAVRGISFSVASGEAVGIVGESGSGKSATVQAITRLSPAAAVRGSVQFEGRDLLHIPENELRLVRGRKIGHIFQDPMTSLNPTMKIKEQICEGLIYHKIAAKTEAFRMGTELLQLAGVPDPELRMNQYPHHLSGGLRQRVLIAIAVACRPQLLIADEPTTALDPTISSQILTLLKNLQKKFHSSLLLITHDLGIVSSICDRVLVMHEGLIVEEGPVDQILLHPTHPYTQSLMHWRRP